MRLCFVLGTAAELIKVLPVIQEAQARGWTWHVLSTGQSPVGIRRQWSDFNLPEENLKVALQTTADLSSSFAALNWFWRAWWMLPEIEADAVLVHGDTLSTLIGATWAKQRALPVVHIEAGLRSSSFFFPFPEEISRRLVSKKATLHMAPDSWAAENLQRAGYSEGVINTGCNTLADTVKAVTSAGKTTTIDRYTIVNIHRFENLTSRKKWKFIAQTLLMAAEKSDLRIVMHAPTEKKIAANPGWREQMESRGAKFLPRQPFTTFIRDLAAAEFVISDGGSNQEECFYLGKPCLLLRGETERREGLGANCVLSKFDKAVVDDFLAQPLRFKRQPAFPQVSPSRVICDEMQLALGRG